MDQACKHFSHLHSLIMHHMPEHAEVSCSGCYSSATGTVFVCWQCNFFLHDQCYRATRSLKHPSHPPHPLTLVPYPTYPSNSFYCNSCQAIGTGFSYSCADCEFDLHVQCAYSISSAAGFNNVHRLQELATPAAWNGVHNSGSESRPILFTGGQNPYIPATSVSRLHDLPSVSVAASYPPIPSGQDPSMRQDGPSVSIPVSSTVQHPPMAHNLASVSIPTNPLLNARYSSMDQTGSSVSTATSYRPNRIPSGQDPSMPQDRPSVSIPMSSIVQHPPMAHNLASVSIPTNPLSNAGYSSMDQTGPSVSAVSSYRPNTIPSGQDPSMAQDGPSVSIPVSSTVQHPSMAHTLASVSIPTNPLSYARYPSMHQTGPSVSAATSYQPNMTPSGQDPSMPQDEPSVSIPLSSQNPIPGAHDHPSSLDPPMAENGFKDKEIMHFSHPHNLSRVDLQEEDEVICSGCEETLIGNSYSCTKLDCNFHLHESCFHLKREIHHKSHPEHSLTLLPSAPYNNKNNEFTCNACFSDGTGFTYHCSICKFDLHIQCVSLPETVKRDDHKHMLKLFYSCPVKDEDYTFSCDVCHGDVQKDRWVYYCEPCDYGTHLGCVDCEECESDSILDTQAQLQRLQFQMEMARQQAQFIASMGSSLSSLAG